MPTLSDALDHIVLSVSDLEVSRRFYEEILGFDLVVIPTDYANSLYAGAFYFVVGGVEITFIHHPQTAASDRFNERRIGLDHLSFRAPDEAALDALVDRLRDAGVETRGVEDYSAAHKKYVVFRDPDNIQLEYWLNLT